jgi:hypothetical protein
MVAPSEARVTGRKILAPLSSTVLGMYQPTRVPTAWQVALCTPSFEGNPCERSRGHDNNHGVHQISYDNVRRIERVPHTVNKN